MAGAGTIDWFFLRFHYSAYKTALLQILLYNFIFIIDGNSRFVLGLWISIGDIEEILKVDE